MTVLHPLTFLCRICNLISFRLIFHFQKICKFCVLYTSGVVSIVENSTFVQDSAPQLFKHSFVRSKRPKPIKTLYLPLVFISSVFVVGDLHDLLMIYNIWSYLHMIYYEHQFLSNITRSNHFLSLLKSPNNQGVWKRPRKRWVGHRSGNRLEWGKMFVRSNALYTTSEGWEYQLLYPVIPGVIILPIWWESNNRNP